MRRVTWGLERLECMPEHATQTAARQKTEASVRGQQAPEGPARQNARSGSRIHEWQQALGNQALQRSLVAGRTLMPHLQRKCSSCAKESDQTMAGLIQTKLTINEPSGVVEQEADRVGNA